MKAVHIYFIFGIAWLIVGVIEFRTATQHAKAYGYKAYLGAARYWLLAGLAAILVAMFICWGQP